MEENELKEITYRMNGFEGKKALITGGAGFLGSWLAESLAGMGAYVTVVDDLSTGRVENLKDLEGNANFKFIRGDAANVSASGYDIIVHGASIPSPDDYFRRPIKTITSNSNCLLNILNTADNDANILYMSTSEVYGDPQVIPTPETYWGNVNPIGMRSCYDETKRFGEALCMAYFREKGTRVKIARIHNTYGPRIDSKLKYARAIPNFIKAAIRNEPIKITGDGSQTRCFTYVTDMIRGFLLLLQNDRLNGSPINIGSDKEMSILDLARKVKEISGSSSKIEFIEAAPDDPRRRKPDTGKARSMLGWEPKISIDDGLERTIKWFRKEQIYSK